jgi:hypothetical protein
MLEKIIRYFDLMSEVKARRRAQGFSASTKELHWFPQWICLFLGIVIQPYFANFQERGVWDFGRLPSWTLFAVITAFLIFPLVYRKAFDEEKPLPVQLGPIFTAGMGWHSLLATAMKAGTTVVRQQGVI